MCLYFSSATKGSSSALEISSSSSRWQEGVEGKDTKSWGGEGPFFSLRGERRTLKWALPVPFLGTDPTSLLTSLPS